MARIRLVAACAAVLLAGIAQARDIEMPYEAYLDLESGRWATESDCYDGFVDCRVMDLKLRFSDQHDPHAFLEFPRPVDQARTPRAPADVGASTLSDLAAYRYASTYGFLPETLVVVKGTRTFAIQLVSETEGMVTLRYELVAQGAVSLVD